MKATEFQAVAEARQAVEVQLSFFNRMMAAKTAATSTRSHKLAAPARQSKVAAQKKK